MQRGLKWMFNRFKTGLDYKCVNGELFQVGSFERRSV